MTTQPWDPNAPGVCGECRGSGCELCDWKGSELAYYERRARFVPDPAVVAAATQQDQEDAA